MTEEHADRTLARMENHVRNFTLVVTGPSFVQGGFGQLPPSTDRMQRIQNLHRALDRFELVGDGVDVSGSIHDGFVIS